MSSFEDTYPAIATDYYEFTMSRGYLENRMENACATFDLFIRSLPDDWGYLLACGIEDAVDFLVDGFSFNSDDLDFLGNLGFPEDFLSFLENLRFTGDVHAVPEGTPVAPNTPIMRVTAPLIQAQLIETPLLNMVNLQTLIATKACRIVRAASGATVVDFGLRRAHGRDAGLKGARAAFVGGCKGTSNVEAGMRYGIPVSGTQAHSWIMAFPSELEAFRAYTRAFPSSSTLLIDTYDVEQGARNAALAAKELEGRGFRLGAVRIDSGDLLALSKKVRDILDKSGLGYVKIIGTGDLNEYRIGNLVREGARIDAYGVGTDLITCRPVAALPGVYKLAQIDGRPVMKLSCDKATYPGVKQVYRMKDEKGMYIEDVMAVQGEEIENGSSAHPLLKCFVSEGHRVSQRMDLAQISEYAASCLSKMPEPSLRILGPEPYRISPSSGLKKLVKDLGMGR